MRDTSSEDILSSLTEARQRVRLWPLFLILTIGSIWAALQLELPLWQTGFIAFSLIGATWIAYIRDSARTTTVLLYDLDEPMLAAYTALNTAFDRAAACSRIWHVQAQARVLDRKYHAGASSVVDTQNTFLVKSAPPRAKMNIQPPVIQLGLSKLYLLPDRILFLDTNGFGAIDYNALHADVEYGTFIFDSAAPSDAEVVNYTWRYVNKRGGPDRRFANNPQLPIIRVADLRLTTSSGLSGILKFANVAAGETLRDGLQSFAKSIANIRSSTAQQRAENRAAPAEEHSGSKSETSWLFVTSTVLAALIPLYLVFQFAMKGAGLSADQQHSAAAENGIRAIAPQSSNRVASANAFLLQPATTVESTSAASAVRNKGTEDASQNDLIAVVKSGTVQQVRTALQSTANVNAGDQQEATALHYAVRRGDLQIVRALIESRADPNAGDDHSATPLHVAALKGRATIADYLLSYKADPNAADVDGWTPLHFAAPARHAFEVESGYPHGRPGYVIDHITPLKRGGADDPSNMQWQTKEDAKAKDRWE